MRSTGALRRLSLSLVVRHHHALDMSTPQNEFDGAQRILKKYYREETLASDVAKGMFLLPDRICGQATGSTTTAVP